MTADKACQGDRHEHHPSSEQRAQFVLFEDAAGRYLMTVTAGGVAMVEVTIELTGDQARSLADDEAKAIELARQVATKTSIFEGRRIRPAVLPEAA